MTDYLNHYKDKTVLITGGGGAIGTNLVRKIAELGATKVIILDDMSAAYEWNIPSLPNVLFVKGSICDETCLKRVFAEKPDIVYHLAAFFANQNSVDYPQRDLEVNGKGTLLIYQYAQMSNTEKVVYASSGCSIYGSAAPMPLKEDFVSMKLTTPYQITKMLGELYGNFFRNHHDVPVVNARLFNSYGPGEVPGTYRNVIPSFFWWARRGEPLPITGTGAETRDFTFVDDLVDGLVRAAVVDDAVGLAVNLASGVETAIARLAELVNEVTGNRAGTVIRPARTWDTKTRLLADIDLARSKLGYSPGTGIEAGIERTARWFDDRWPEITVAARFGR